MAVFVTMSVKPPDAGKFEAAIKEAQSERPAGLQMQFWGRVESDPSTYIVGGVWDSHDAMHAYSEKVGDEFNAKAGTEGVEWQTNVYEVMGTS